MYMDWDEIGLGRPNTGWGPNGPGHVAQKMIDDAITATRSVSYKVSLRWVFYRLWQNGDLAHVKATPSVPAKVNAYRHLKGTCSKAVHYGLLNPNWVADDTRGASGRWGYESVQKWIDSIQYESCQLDWWSQQHEYVMIAFEAAAMAQQFDHYTSDYGTRMFPMRGDPSNPYKWSIAKTIESIGGRYKMPIVILYFGDLDKKGISIPEAAFRDIHQWSRYPFKVYRVGLNPGDESKYNLPDIPGKPGSYQWEALEDKDAETIITGALDEFMDQDVLQEMIDEEEQATEKLQSAIQKMLSDYEV